MTDPRGQRLGGLLLNLEDNTVASLTIAIDGDLCTKALDPRGRAQIDSSTFRKVLGRQRDEAVLKSRFLNARFTGRLAIADCELNASVAASPRAE